MRPAFSFPPLPRPSTDLSRRGASRRYDSPSLRSGNMRCPRNFLRPSLPPSRRVAPLGNGRPRFGHSPAAGASGRGLRRGLAFLAPPSSRHTSWSGSTAGLRVELASRLSSRSGRARLCLGQGPRPTTRACARLRQAKRPACGAAANRPPSCRTGVSAARFHAPKRGGLGTRFCGSGRNTAASVGGLHLMPPLQGARTVALAYAHRPNPPKAADLRRCLSVRAFRDHFSVKIGR